MKTPSAALRATLAAAAMLALAGCETPDNISPQTGTLIGAGSGALAGAAIGDGGIILPALGAVAGAVIGEEAAERDPIFD